MNDTELSDQEKAQIVLQARDSGDPRFVMFVVLMQARTGLTPECIVAQLEAMACGAPLNECEPEKAA